MTGVRITPRPPRQGRLNTVGSLIGMVRETFQETARLFATLWQQPAFYRFMGFLFLLVALRLIYFHMYYTYPKFGIRELGEGAPVGRLWSLNGWILIFLVPLVGAMTQRIPAYPMILCGSIISGCSVFIMALPPHWFQTLANGWLGAWLGHGWLGLQGIVAPYYIMIFFYVLLLSVGEALWNPRLYEYTAATAPKGQEASYMSLSYLPYFVAKLFAGAFSGLLLARYCPASGPRHSQTLWLIIALTTFITPVGLLVFGRFVRVREAGRGE